MKTRTTAMQQGRAGFKAAALVWVALAALACAAAVPSTAWGFASWSKETDPTGYTHFLNNPNDFPSWDKINLTYKFDSSFTSAWPNAAIRGQIREAFRQWDTAHGTANGAIYSYNRANGYQSFVDIRSVAVHEIGHVLGLRHADQADDVNRNWRPSGATYSIQPDNGNEVMRHWINQGDYNHVLSHDELDGFDRLYGHDLSFSETTGASADIVIKAYTAAATNWAVGGWSGNWRNNGDHSQGIRITSGEIKFNTTSMDPLGLMSLGINWDYQNAGGMPTRAFEVRTNGTNNPNVMSHYDNQGGGGVNRFNAFASSPVGANAKDDLLHVWSNPNSGDIPAAQIIHVGLEQDVWDWNVVSAKVRHPDGSKTDAPLLGFHDWSHTIVEGTPAAGGGAITQGPKVITVARGIRLAAASEGTSLVSDLVLGCVDGMGLMLDDLNRDMLQRLTKDGIVEPIGQFGERNMRAGQDFIIVLDGTEDDLPPDVREMGNFLILNRPDFLDQELFVSALGREGGATVGTYALLGRAPLPEPATLSLLALGAAALLRRRRKP